MLRKFLGSSRTFTKELFLVVCILALTAGAALAKPAPNFTLPDILNGKDYSLSQFRGKENVVLAFYVLAFTGG